MKSRRLALTLFGLAAFSFMAADWPQWRGPERTGISQETGLLQEWPAGGPKLLWQVKDLGQGYSTPAVAGDRLYLISNRGPDNEFVQARSAADGKPIWETRIGKVGPNEGQQYPGARSTPTVEGEVLFALGSDGNLACLEIASGKPRWQKNLRTDFGGRPGNWAYAESPLVDGQVLVCTPGGSEATIVALDKVNGELIWKTPLASGEEAAYSSPIVVEAGGIKQYVQMLQNGIVGVDAKTGKLLWRYEKTAKSPANIPTPVVEGDFVYSASGRGGGGLVQIKSQGGGLIADEVYSGPKLPTSIGGAVKIGDYLYGTNTQGLMCVDFATGDLKWQERGVGAGSVCLADGRLYVHGEAGDVALVEATPDAYRERGRFTPPGQPDRGRGRAWTYPVVANGKLYIHDFGVLWCYDVRAR